MPRCLQRLRPPRCSSRMHPQWRRPRRLSRRTRLRRRHVRRPRCPQMLRPPRCSSRAMVRSRRALVPAQTPSPTPSTPAVVMTVILGAVFTSLTPPQLQPLWHSWTIESISTPCGTCLHIRRARVRSTRAMAMVRSRLAMWLRIRLAMCLRSRRALVRSRTMPTLHSRIRRLLRHRSPTMTMITRIRRRRLLRRGLLRHCRAITWRSPIGNSMSYQVVSLQPPLVVCRVHPPPPASRPNRLATWRRWWLRCNRTSRNSSGV